MIISPGKRIKGQKRQRIIEGARLAFIQNGYEGASMAHIARLAGVSKGTLYNYFKSKPALFTAFVEHASANTVEPLEQLDQEATIASFLADLARRWMRDLLSEPVLTLDRIVLSEAMKFPHLASIYLEAGHLRRAENFARWLTIQSGRGLIKVEDPSLAAEQFLALCRTRLWLRCCFYGRERAMDVDIDVIAASVVSMFLNSYGEGVTLKQKA